jgi:hypothetical protein
MPESVWSEETGGCLLMLALAFAVLFGFGWLFDRVHAARCPAGTFFAGSNFTVVTILGRLLFVGVCPGVAIWLVGLIPGAQSTWDGWAKIITFRKLKATSALIAVVSAIVSIPLTVPDLFDQKCLTPVEIWNQVSPWGGFKRYRWADVDTLAISCIDVSSGHSGAPTWLATPELRMKDGTRMLLGDMVVNEDIPAYPQVARALHGHDFKFDTSEVATGCNADALPMLLRHP